MLVILIICEWEKYQLANICELESCRSPKHLERNSCLSHTESFSFLSVLQSQLVKSNPNGLLYFLHNNYYSYQCLIRFKFVTEISFVIVAQQTKQLCMQMRNSSTKIVVLILVVVLNPQIHNKFCSLNELIVYWITV